MQLPRHARSGRCKSQLFWPLLWSNHYSLGFSVFRAGGSSELFEPLRHSNWSLKNRLAWPFLAAKVALDFTILRETVECVCTAASIP